MEPIHSISGKNNPLKAVKNRGQQALGHVWNKIQLSKNFIKSSQGKDDLKSVAARTFQATFWGVSGMAAVVATFSFPTSPHTPFAAVLGISQLGIAAYQTYKVAQSIFSTIRHYRGFSQPT
ncbi:MAG: hypothetical protein ACQEP8_02470 [Chlamydiota bacterium]